MSVQVFGLPVSRGVAIGRAVLVASSWVDVAHYFIEADQVGAEIRRLKAENKRLREDVAILKAATTFFAGELCATRRWVYREAVRDRLLRVVAAA